jgi:hypothetical protein
LTSDLVVGDAVSSSKNFRKRPFEQIRICLFSSQVLSELHVRIASQSVSLSHLLVVISQEADFWSIPPTFAIFDLEVFPPLNPFVATVQLVSEDPHLYEEKSCSSPTAYFSR